MEPAFSSLAGLSPDDPYARHAQTFPRLDDDMAERVTGYGQRERLPAGTLLFQRGQRHVDFFLVLSGSVEIYEVDDDGHPKVFTVHDAHGFTGELDLFNERPILVSGRTGSDTEVVRVPRANFRRLMAAEPDIAEIIMRAFILRRVGLIRHAQGGVVVVGSSRVADTLRIERFLIQNGYPHRLLDIDDPSDAAELEGCRLQPDDLPIVRYDDHRLLHNPSDAELADALGIAEAIDEHHLHDVAVVGAGPAGLAAAVYAASEGLDVVVVEGHAPGGQAGTSSKIENYLGFPTGISGQALAGRAQVQAQKFGARLAISRHVVALHHERPYFRVDLEGDRSLRAKAVVVATGARYRRLDLESGPGFEGQGIHYAATAMEEKLCIGEAVIVVGGGNSAGQAAMYLSRRSAHVHIVVRGEGLAESMSDYLVRRIAASPRITLHTCTRIVELQGERSLERVVWKNLRTGERETKSVRNVFVMIGAEPNTGWLRDCVALDAHGFVQTGTATSPYETSRPGVFAVGDVRSNSIKRVASAVGEGSVVVHALHRYLFGLEPLVPPNSNQESNS